MRRLVREEETARMVKYGLMVALIAALMAMCVMVVGRDCPVKRTGRWLFAN